MANSTTFLDQAIQEKTSVKSEVLLFHILWPIRLIEIMKL